MMILFRFTNTYGRVKNTVKLYTTIYFSSTVTSRPILEYWIYILRNSHSQFTTHEYLKEGKWNMLLNICFAASFAFDWKPISCSSETKRWTVRYWHIERWNTRKHTILHVINHTWNWKVLKQKSKDTWFK